MSASVCAAEMIPLPAAPVVEDRLSAVLVAHSGEALGHLTHHSVPVDLLERAVGTPAKGIEDTLATPVLVVVEPQRLLARVPLRRGVGLVAADAHHRRPVGAHLDAAVDRAEDAGGLVPVHVARGSRWMAVVGHGLLRSHGRGAFNE